LRPVQREKDANEPGQNQYQETETMKTLITKPHWARCVAIAALALSSLLLVAAVAQAQAKKPNILII
jgi:hypothetical protein